MPRRWSYVMHAVMDRPLCAVWYDAVALLGLLLLLFLGVTWSYRQPMRYHLPIERQDGLYRDGLGSAEYGGSEGVFRWADPYTLIRFPGVGAALHSITLTLHTPAHATGRTVGLRGGGEDLSTDRLRPGWRQLSLLVPPRAIQAAHGDLDLVLTVEPPLVVGHRTYGVALRGLALQQLRPAVVPPQVLRQLVFALGLIVVPLRLLRCPVRVTTLLGGLLGLLTIVFLAVNRIAVLLGVPAATRALALAVLGIAPLRLWVDRQTPGRRWASGVASAAVILFVVHVGGLLHPQFVPIDHLLRVHQIMAISTGGRAQVQAALSRQYEWGRDLRIPYSLLSYDLFVPFVPLLSSAQLLTLVEATTAALNASVMLLLWSITRRSNLNARIAFWSAALVGLLPIVHLYLHDGSYPTIIGLWSVVLALWLLTRLVAQPSWWLAVGSSVALAASMGLYVTHVVFVPALLGIAVMSGWMLGTPPLRRRVVWVAGATGGGLVLALIGCYRPFLPDLVRTVSQYSALVWAGVRIGHDPSLLPGALLGSTWAQLWGHYRIVGMAFAVVGLLLSLSDRGAWRTHLLVGYAGFLTVTALVDVPFGLWNKHWYFALPGVALAAGATLGQMQTRGLAGRLVVLSISGYLLWASMTAWGLRVVQYIWSLQTL